MTRIYPRTGRSRMTGILALMALTLVLGSCRASSIYGNPGDVADIFYAHQEAGAEAMPDSLFTDEETQQRVLEELNGRVLSSGELVSRKKVGSNFQVFFGDQGREETLTYVFEVDCLMGMTRETLVLKRGRKSEPYKISSYQVEHVKKMNESTPMSSNSA